MNNNKSKLSFLEDKLDKRKSTNSYRVLSKRNDLVDFSSNDYLGFSSSKELKAKINSVLSRYDSDYIGSTGSRLITGNSSFIEQLESEIALFHNAPSGLIFNSGYDANVGLFSSVPQRGDTIIYDELIHASIRDGIRLSTAKSFSFEHNDLNDLKEKLSKAEGNIFIAVESVYSMDGDIAPLEAIVDFKEQYNNIYIIVDEAHATGVIGSRGEGLVQKLNLQDKVFARVHTFGKALGTHGAIVLGDVVLRNYLINFARSFIYTTALPVHSIINIKCAYDLLQSSNLVIKKLNDNIKLFKQLICNKTNVQLTDSITPIQSIIIAGNDNVKQIAASIQQKGYDVRPILSPTVPEGKERLRICLHAFNTNEEIAGLVSLLLPFMNN